jgi:hypothetical protein
MELKLKSPLEDDEKLNPNNGVVVPVVAAPIVAVVVPGKIRYQKPKRSKIQHNPF